MESRTIECLPGATTAVPELVYAETSNVEGHFPQENAAFR
jgi:hypothetical protein